MSETTAIHPTPEEEITETQIEEASVLEENVETSVVESEEVLEESIEEEEEDLEAEAKKLEEDALTKFYEILEEFYEKFHENKVFMNVLDSTYLKEAFELTHERILKKEENFKVNYKDTLNYINKYLRKNSELTAKDKFAKAIDILSPNGFIKRVIMRTIAEFININSKYGKAGAGRVNMLVTTLNRIALLKEYEAGKSKYLDTLVEGFKSFIELIISKTTTDNTDDVDEQILHDNQQ